MLIFLFFWLGGWTVGGVTVIANLIGGAEGEEAAFSLFWLGGWVLGMLFASSVLGWALLGREVITVRYNAMTLTREAGPLRREKRFARDRIQRLRTHGYPGLFRGMFVRPRDSWHHGMEMWGLGGGSIVFDYGARTHRFGSKLDEAESRQLVEVLRRELRLPDEQAP